MKEVLYGLYSDDELVYVGKIEDTAEAYCAASNCHLNELRNGGNSFNYMYEYLLDRKEEGCKIRMHVLEKLPNDIDIEVARKALVYSLRPVGNWHEYKWLEEKEEEERNCGNC